MLFQVFSWMVCRFKINYSKSHFGCLGKSASWCREAAQFLNCSTLEFPFTYLGIPVGVSSKSWIVWQPIVRKFEVKLAKWKQRTLSMGGKITLINFVLSYSKAKDLKHQKSWRMLYSFCDHG